MSSASRPRRALAGLAAALVALPLLTAAPVSAQGATVGDAAALIAAVAAEEAEIVLSGDITLSCDEGAASALEVGHALTLRSDGNGPHTLSVSGNGCRNRIIEVSGGHSLVIEDLVLTGGRAPHGADGTPESIDGQPGGSGGAVLSDGAVTVTRSTFSGNHAGDGGAGHDGADGEELGDAGEDGGIGGEGGRGGAIHASGTIVATESSFSGNLAGNGGTGGDGGNGSDGAAAATGGSGGAGGDGGHGGDAGHGGAVSSDGEVEVRRSTLDGNQAGSGGNAGAAGDGGQGGAGEEGGNNGSGGAGGDGGDGGDGGQGGAVRAQSATISASTLHANSVGTTGAGGAEGAGGGPGAGDGDSGGVGATGAAGTTGSAGSGGAVATSDSIDAISSTITDNTAGSLQAGNDLDLTHTVVSGDGADCAAGGSVSASNSADGDGRCNGASTLNDTELALGPLATNGGPTRTRLPDPASELVNGGDTGCPSDRDQRGVRRPQQGACDIGAVEVRGSFEGIVTGEVDDDTVGVGQSTNVTFQLTVAADATGAVDADEIQPVIDGCAETPARLGGSLLTAGSTISWICPVTSDVAGALAVNFSATAPDGEDGITNLNAVAQVTFTQGTTTTDGNDTTTTAPVTGGVGDDQTDAGNGALPRTGLSVLIALAAGAALLFGGGGLSRFSKTRVGRSRWGLPYGEVRPIESPDHTSDPN